MASKGGRKWPAGAIVALILAIVFGLALFALVGLVLTGNVGATHYVTQPGPTVTATETTGIPVEPTAAPGGTKTAVPSPSPATGVLPGGTHVQVWVVYKATIHINKQILNAVCAARQAGAHVNNPPLANDAGAHLHCVSASGKPLPGFDMTGLCQSLTQYLKGHWNDLGNENNPFLWECQLNSN